MKYLDKIFKHLPRALAIIYALFLGLTTHLGFEELREAWGLKEGGLFQMFGAMSMILVIASTWDLRRILSGEQNRNEKNDAEW